MTNKILTMNSVKRDQFENVLNLKIITARTATESEMSRRLSSRMLKDGKGTAPESYKPVLEK